MFNFSNKFFINAVLYWNLTKHPLFLDEKTIHWKYTDFQCSIIHKLGRHQYHPIISSFGGKRSVFPTLHFPHLRLQLTKTPEPVPGQKRERRLYLTASNPINNPLNLNDGCGRIPARKPPGFARTINYDRQLSRRRRRRPQRYIFN